MDDYFANKYGRDVKNLNFSEKLKFFDFENQARSRSGSEEEAENDSKIMKNHENDSIVEKVIEVETNRRIECSAPRQNYPDESSDLPPSSYHSLSRVSPVNEDSG